MAVTTDHGPVTEAAAPAGAYSPLYTCYITFILALVTLLASADRNILNVLLIPIQDELQVSDSMMGLLSGTAFSLVYATVALPLGWAADRGNRRNLIALAVGFWSVMTALCGAASSYLTLMLARVGVAAGEAGHQPAILSLVGDLYAQSRRGIAVGSIYMGSSLGIGAGSWLAGRLAEDYGWRVAFLALGLPGVAVALLVFLTLPEPTRGAFEGRAAAKIPNEGVWKSLKYLASVKTIPRLLGAKLILQIGFMGFLAWSTAFFVRIHGMTNAEAAGLFGLSVMLGGVAAQIIAGLGSDFLAKKGERWRAYWCTGCLLAGVPFVLMVILGSTNLAVFGLFMIAILAGGATTGSITAGLGVVRPAMRGFMTAVMMFCILGVGGSLGPLVIGGLNDALKATYGDGAIRYTMLFVPVSWTLAAGLFWLAGRTTDHDAALALGEAGPAGA